MTQSPIFLTFLIVRQCDGDHPCGRFEVGSSPEYEVVGVSNPNIATTV